MKRLLFILAMLATTSVFAQKAEKPLVQFSGVVMNADSSKAVLPYVTITNLSSNNQVNLANYKGYFSFVAHEQDTLRFSSIGFSTVLVVIPSGLTEKKLYHTGEIEPGYHSLAAGARVPMGNNG